MPRFNNAITLTNQSTFKYTLPKVQSHYDGQQYSQAVTKALIQERNIDQLVLLTMHSQYCCFG